MKRRLFNAATMVSLVLGLAMIGLWVRSFDWFGDDVLTIARGPVWFIASRNGQIDIAGPLQPEKPGASPDPDTPWQDDRFRMSDKSIDIYSQWYWNGFGLGLVDPSAILGPGSPRYIVAVPHLFLASVLLVPPGCWLYTTLRHSWRARRRLYHAAAMASLLLSLGMAVLWVRSWWWDDSLAVGPRSLIWSDQGVFRLQARPRDREFCFILDSCEVTDRDVIEKATEDAKRSIFNDENGLYFWYWRGFGLALPIPSGNEGVFILDVPHWFAVLALLAFPAWWLHRRPERVKRDAELAKRDAMIRGVCRKCGYDLRASTGNCPECGAGIPAVSK
ncbi:MAG: hypothetical protein K8S99_16220 [Planctomycetes bacterium]|nr:hypothetical protein [Planctomycetota bacterium]